jgi:hypothetical protein
VAANGWTYSAVTLDADGNLTSYIGPDGGTWNFYDYDTLFASYEEPEDFYATFYSAHPFDDYFDFEDYFALFETYTSSYKWFYYYDSEGHLCELTVDKDEDGNILGYDVNDSYDSCPLVEEGWSYMEVTLVEGYGEKEWPIKSYIGPDGEEWQFYTEEVLFE